MNNNSKPQSLFKLSLKILLIKLVLAILFFIVFFKLMSLNTKYLHKKYSNIEKSTSIRGKILKIYDDRGSTYYTLADGKRFWTNERIIKNINRKSLVGNAKPFDSIYKKKDCDTIMLVRNGQKYYFWIGDY